MASRATVDVNPCGRAGRAGRLRRRLRCPSMFSPLGLFHSLPCPNKLQCRRKNCLFSHKSGVVENPVSIPYDTPQPVASSSALASRPSVPAKRPAASSPTHALSSANAASSVQPQRKLQKVGTAQKPLALPTASRTPVSCFGLFIC